MNTYKTRNRRLSWPLWAGAIVLVGLIIVGILQVTHTIHLFRKPTVATSASFTSKGENSTPTTSSSPAATSQSSNTDSKANAQANQAVLTPSGNFVSNHHPNLSGWPTPNTLVSVCEGTPEASCFISFTMGNTTKSLSTQTISQTGSAYWSWKLQDVGLTVGTWQIKATSTIDGHTATSVDALNLVVSE